MTINKTKLAQGIAAATISMAIYAPLAQADAATAQRTATEAAQKAEALELQMQQMSSMMQSMQAELNRVKASAEKASTANAKVQELDQWMSAVKSTPETASSKDNLVAVRAGWSQLDHARNTGSDITQNGGLLSNNLNASGFYVGGAFDFNVNNDLFGTVDNTSFLVELGFEYGQYGKAVNSLGAVTTVGAPVNPYQATDARLRLNASPKIKFFHGSKLRPWIIPVGLELNILGVPSNAVSVLNSGMQFGGGLEYDIFRGITLGTDARYHYSTSKVDGTATDGFTLGSYVGFKF